MFVSGTKTSKLTACQRQEIISAYKMQTKPSSKLWLIRLWGSALQVCWTALPWPRHDEGAYKALEAWCNLKVALIVPQEMDEKDSGMCSHKRLMLVDS